MSKNVQQGGVAVRINRLRMTHKNPTLSIAGMEAHGKRFDTTSQSRKVNDRAPLVYGSLDLEAAFDAHTDGCRFSSRVVAPVLHAILQWPIDMPLVDEAAEQLMLKRSVDFMNRTLGGSAVFAARLDRDETGRHSVDVFCTPKYMKKTKQGEQLWVSTSKHLKALCGKHLPEILRRHPKIKNPDSLRCQGIAINSEFHEFVTSLGMSPKPKIEKFHSVPDRVSPEAYAAAAEATKVIEAAKMVGAELEAQQSALEASKAEFVEFQRQATENAAIEAAVATKAREAALLARETEVLAKEVMNTAQRMAGRLWLGIEQPAETQYRNTQEIESNEFDGHTFEYWEDANGANPSDRARSAFEEEFWGSRLKAHIKAWWGRLFDRDAVPEYLLQAEKRPDDFSP